MLRATAQRNFAMGATTLPPIASTFDLTHTVTNQSVPLADFNLFQSNPRYVSAVRKYSTGSAGAAAAFSERCEAFGKVAGTSEMLEAAHVCNKATPTFASFDRFGRRSPGRAEFHPSYHTMMGLAVSHRIPSLAWAQPTAEENYGAVVARSALTGMHYQLEQGTSCPLTMTFAGVAPLRRALKAAVPNSKLAKELSAWIQQLTSDTYDPRDQHIQSKDGATIGMSMTEKQGGSDVRANTTVATPVVPGQYSSDSEPCYYTLRGHKWFTSAPMCDAFLTLAYVPKPSSATSSSQKEGRAEGDDMALSCFLVPRWIAPDTPNAGLQFQRLKEKMGDKSNASSEVEYHDAVGMLVGEVGKGVKTIIEMVNLTRLDCLNGSGALMQRAALEATHHALNRSAFGAKLIDQPLMQNVLCDLAIECEAATALGMRIAHGFGSVAKVNDCAGTSASSASAPSAETVQEANFSRLAVAISKYFVCKRSPAVVYEALECLGGNGYTEDFPMARLFRQSPLNAIWEGSGNVIVLDVFRAAAKEKDAVDALRSNLAGLAKKDKRLLESVKAVEDAFMAPLSQQVMEGRRTVELMAKLLQADALHPSSYSSSANGGGSAVEVESVEELIYDAFVETRLLGEGASCVGLGRRCDLLGTLPARHVSRSIMDRITPKY